MWLIARKRGFLPSEMEAVKTERVLKRRLLARSMAGFACGALTSRGF